MSKVDYPLVNGGHAHVDEEDLCLLAGYEWRRVKCRDRWYAASDSVKHSPRRIYMHRFLLGVHAASLPMVDHADGNGLNNTRTNIRLASAGLNAHNITTKRRFRGVFRAGNAFIARVANSYGGCHETESAAAVAADKVAANLYGAAARLNFPPDLGSPWLNSRFLLSL